MDQKTLLKLFEEREKASSTALSPFFAVPHVVVDQKDTFKLLVVRSKKGIRFDDKKDAVRSIFFLVGSMDQRHFHLVTLSALAGVVQSKNFEKNWSEAGSTENLRELILKTKRGL